MAFMVTVEEAHEFIVKADMIIEEGEMYTIYSCGHVFLGSEDPQIIKKFPSKRKKYRSCPICTEAKHLIAKYKLCYCGLAQVGNTTQSSPTCRACAHKKRLSVEKEEVNSKKRNANMADPERWDCIHRDKCICTYIGHQAIPCLGCEKYKSKYD